MGKIIVKEPVYSTAEAAEYVGLSLDVLKYHIYTQGHLKPDFQLGRENGFYQSTLDEFIRQHQSSDMTLAEAAEYLNISLNQMRYHVYTTRLITPDSKRGKFNTFSKELLDAVRPFIRNRRSA